MAAAMALLALPAQMAAAADDEAGKPAPYVLIHKDGYRIDAMEKPVREGGKVKVRLAPQGLLTILPETDIDWTATEKYNAQFEKMAPQAPTPPAAETKPAGGGPVIEKTIVGSKIGASLAAMKADEEAAAGEGEPGEAGAAKPPAEKANPAAAAAAQAQIAKELDNVQKARDSALATKSQLEAQIAALQGKVANEPPSSGIQEYESPSRKALATAQEQLSSVTAQIQTLESRINELQYQVSLAVDPPAEE